LEQLNSFVGFLRKLIFNSVYKDNLDFYTNEHFFEEEELTFRNKEKLSDI